jgi:Flp pilus assembly pilin Flp
MINLYLKGRQMILRAYRNEEGASLAEYALLIALVLVGTSAAVVALTGAVNGAIAQGTNELTPAAAGG